MHAKMISPWKRPNSANYWFRLAVPPRYRAKIGQTEIKQSLRTTDAREAKQLCAILQGEWLTKFAALDAILVVEAERSGIEIVDAFFDFEAESDGGLDAVIAYELEGLAVAESACLDAITTEQIVGIELARTMVLPVAEPAYPAYRGHDERKLIATRQNLLDQRGVAGLLPGLEAARRALALRYWPIAANFLQDAFAHADRPLDPAGATFSSAGEHYLRRLINHPDSKLAEVAAAFPAPAAITPASINPAEDCTTHGMSQKVETNKSETSTRAEVMVPARPRLFAVDIESRTISGVFASWAATQPLNAAKLIDEWAVAIRRFVDLFGNIDVADVDSDMIADFRDAMVQMPSRPRHAVAALPVLEQIEIAKAEKLQTLAGPTIAKLVSGIRVVLSHACDPLRIIRANPASGVKVAKSTSSADARLPFDHDDLKLIFSHPMIVDPCSRASDTEVWLQVAAPLTGLRIEEMGKLRPSNIRCERGIWYIAIERDRAVRRRKEEESGDPSKQAKTESSYRHVAVHWLLVEMGFLDFVQIQKDANADWLFEDLEPDEYGNRSKNVSRRLIRHFRHIGISDEEKVFYSFRHTMKRECRGRPMKEEIADLLAGHAPANVGRKYGAGAHLSVLKDAVDMIDYDMVNWDAVIAATRARVSKMARLAFIQQPRLRG